MSITQLPPMVDALGAARRLQALACAGYGTAHLGELMVAHRLHVRAWQRHEHRRIRLTTHERIDYTYWRLIDQDGPSTLAKIYAAQRRPRWHPIEAWTPETIDDPSAAPYSGTDALLYVDEELIERVQAGIRNYLDLTDTEKMVLFERHLLNDGSIRGFRNRYRPVPKRQFERLILQTPRLHGLLRPDDRPKALREQEKDDADQRLVG